MLRRSRGPAHTGRRPRRRLLLAGALGAVGAPLLVFAIAFGHSVGGFEIDADSHHTAVGDALYSGTEPGSPGDDWAKGTAANGVFEPSTGLPHTAATNCYGSNVDKAAAGELSAFICDGHSDNAFRPNFTEQTIVSPSGKTPDDVWPIKPGEVRGKNDFSHAYAQAALIDSPCDTDTVANNIGLRLGGHVGDNEGDHFWGFEFDRLAPAGFEQLKQNNGQSFSLNFDRRQGDFLVSFTVPGNDGPVELEIFRVQADVPNSPAVWVPAGARPGCPAAAPQGATKLATNNGHDVKAPPWNVPVCDPTADNPQNQCRLANGTTPAEDLLASRDFAEATIDLFAFGIDPCVSNVIFTSRSAHPLEGADIQDVGGADFNLCGKKSGMKFHDHNANGVKDAGDEAIAGWPISLYRDADGDKVLEDADDGSANGQFTPARPVQNTGADGSYSFDNIANGNYIVCEAADPGSAGWHQSLPNAGTAGKADCSAVSGLATVGYGFLMDGTIHAGNDFGNYKNASKSGTKFVDTNGDGDRDAGEPGLAGVEIHLSGSDNVGAAVHRHATTAADGSYSFPGIRPGSYEVCETVPSGFTQSYPTDTTGGSTACVAPHSGRGWSITLLSGDADTGNDFGNFANGTKSGTKFEDVDADGVRDAGEPGIEGVEIHLVGTDNRNNAVHLHTNTNAAGNYSFSAPPGSYTACETVPAGYIQSYPKADTAGSVDCTAPHGGRGWSVSLTSGSVDSGNDFGNFRPASKSGTKFDDVNGNGVRDGGEPGIAGVEIHLSGTDNVGTAVHRHTTTGADGGYSFAGIRPGTYSVCETVPSGSTQSYPTTSTAGTAACTDPHSGRGWAITLASGENDTGNDFGNFRNGTKSGTKFEDDNADGDRDPGEPGLGGVEIHLVGTDGRGNPVHLHTTTAGDGSYSFSAPPGSYTACETVPTGYLQSFPKADTPSSVDCTDPHSGRGWSVTLTSGSTDSGNDFGNFRNASKSGTKFDDLDGDGARDDGEPGKAGVEIHLSGTDGAGTAVHRHVTTGADGGYSFTGVRPGSYEVCETVPDGFTQSYPTDTTGGSTACTAPHGGRGWAITLVSGQADTGNDFGNFANGTKSGTKFDDLNANGARDAGEPGIEGVEIHLVGTDGRGNPVHMHATTAADGSYSFSAPPGIYTACETVPATYAQSYPKADTAGSVDCTDPHSGRGWAVTLTSGSIHAGNDFGNFRQATLSGTKFKDRDADHVRDVLDPVDGPLSGWTIELRSAAGAVLATDVTDANGDYSFVVDPGTYRICEVIGGQTGWEQTFPTAATIGHFDCSAIAGDGPDGYERTVTSGQTSAGLDFGNTPLSRIHVTFEALADLPGGGDATHATAITCTDNAGQSVDGTAGTNSRDTVAVRTSQSSVTCVVSFEDP